MRAPNLPAWVCMAAVATLPAAALAQVPSSPRSNLQNTLPQAPNAPPASSVRADRPDDGEARAGTPVHPREVRIAGVKSIPFGEVSALFRGFVNRDTTVGELVDTARKVAERYNAHGYALSYAYLPQQDFADGVVQVVVVEGYVSGVSFRNLPPQMEGRIRALAAHIVGERPLTARTFQRYVSLIARLPDVGVDAHVPIPETTDGASTLELAFRHRRFTASYAVDVDHPGFEGLLTGNVNGLTQLGDQLSVGAMAPRGDFDRNYYSLDYSLPLGSDGMLLHASAYRYRARAKPFFVNGSPLRQDYGDERAGLALSYPFVLSASGSLTGEIGAYAARSGDVYTEPPFPDRLDARAGTRSLQLSLQGSRQVPDHEGGFELNYARGFNCCGASQEVSLVNLDYDRWRASVRHSDRWFRGRWGTNVAAVGQHTGKFLPVTERINFGGAYFGAAYPNGELTGESGWAASFDVNRSFKREGFVRQVEPYLGADRATAWLVGRARPQPLMSAIVGVRIAGEKYNFNLARAKPVGARPQGENGRPWRWNVQASVSF